MFDKSYDRKRRALLIVSVIGGLVILGLIIVLIVYNVNRNQYGDGVTIQNFDKLVKNLPKERKDAIFNGLYTMVKLNSNGAVPSIDDAVIRDGSETQTPAKPGQYSGAFIVDIASIHQSYGIQYSYSSGTRPTTL